MPFLIGRNSGPSQVDRTPLRSGFMHHVHDVHAECPRFGPTRQCMLASSLHPGQASRLEPDRDTRRSRL